MLSGSCHCGLIHLAVPSAPPYLNSCDCSICRCYGTLWAYYAPSEVRIQCKPGGATQIYQCNDRVLEFHRCRECGCVTHWAPVDKTETRMGVNARLLDPKDLADVPVKQSHWPGKEE